MKRFCVANFLQLNVNKREVIVFDDQGGGNTVGATVEVEDNNSKPFRG